MYLTSLFFHMLPYEGFCSLKKNRMFTLDVNFQMNNIPIKGNNLQSIIEY